MTEFKRRDNAQAWRVSRDSYPPDWIRTLILCGRARYAYEGVEVQTTHNHQWVFARPGWWIVAESGVIYVETPEEFDRIFEAVQVEQPTTH